MLLIVSMILVCIKTGVGIVTPLLLSWLLVFIFCRVLGYDFDHVFGVGLDAMRKAAGAMTIMIAVGILVGVMISAGTIPAFIYYGLKIINPKIFLLCNRESLIAIATDCGEILEVSDKLPVIDLNDAETIAKTILSYFGIE